MDIILTTPEQIESIFEKCLSKYYPLVKSEVTGPESSKYLYSVRELADFLGCSLVTAHKLKKSGKIRFTQFGRKLVFNTDQILEDLNRRRKG
jgi:excisionase family DNA binding protein